MCPRDQCDPISGLEYNASAPKTPDGAMKWQDGTQNEAARPYMTGLNATTRNTAA